MSQFRELQNYYIEQEIEEETTHISYEDSKDEEINEEIENRNNNEQEEIKFTQNSENKRLSSSPKKYQTFKMDFKEKVVMEVIQL